MHIAEPPLDPLSVFVTGDSRVCRDKGRPAHAPQDLWPRECNKRSPAHAPRDYGPQVQSNNNTHGQPALVNLWPRECNKRSPAHAPRDYGLQVHHTLYCHFALEKFLWLLWECKIHMPAHASQAMFWVCNIPVHDNPAHVLRDLFRMLHIPIHDHPVHASQDSMDHLLKRSKATMSSNHSQSARTMCHDKFGPAKTGNLPWIFELYLKILLNFHRMVLNFRYRDAHLVKKCQRLKVFMMHSLWRKHDFMAYIRKLKTSSTLCSGEVIFEHLVLYHLYAVQYVVKWLVKCYSIYMRSAYPSNTSVICPRFASEKVIGGGSHLFSFEELEPYFMSTVHENEAFFRFKGYVAQSQAVGFSYMCMVPLNHLLPKLTVAELRTVATCHGVSTRSKMHNSEIQKAINDHMCMNCCDHVSIFDIVQKSKEANLNAVKAYQKKKASEYKVAHLESVKKNQQKQGTEYKFSHLNSVKKNQEKQGLLNYKMANLGFVKKYQADHGTEFKTANLESVKKYQAGHGAEFKVANLESVKKYQAEHGAEFKAENLESVKKYQAEHGAEFKVANLESVMKYQAEHGAGFKAANLESVKKYQMEHDAEFKVANLESVKKYQAEHGAEFKVANLESVMKYQAEHGAGFKKANLEAVKRHKKKKFSTLFPPSPPSLELQHAMVSGACKDMAQITETGCAVCGKLTPSADLTKLSQCKLNLGVLADSGVTRRERFCSNDSIKSLVGPVLIQGLNSICTTCNSSIAKGKIPKMALANGKWLGEVPEQLADLSFAEQLLVSRIRHNRCIVRVSSGMHKMRANAITFANPIVKVYDILPPPVEDLDEVLAFIYTGPCQPTQSDFERTPLLVRRRKVQAALEWSKLNHADYYDLEISQRNLEAYPEHGPPVVVDYRKSFSNKNPESTAVNDSEDEEGTDLGKCPFVVHGLTGEEYSTKSLKAMKAIALKHLTSNKKILAIGHEPEPESIYDNPQLFPQMLPWLFPYGLGGIGNSLQHGHISDIAHKRHLF